MSGMSRSMSEPMLKKSGNVSDMEKKALMKYGHHVEYTPTGEIEGAGRQFTKNVKTVIYIPEEKMVKVPVVRKEKEKIVERHVVKASKLVPVTKYKEVQEINLPNRPVLPGEKARSGAELLKTYKKAHRTRKIPYTDFEEQEYDVVVDVPREVVKTRVGHRMDKQLLSHAVEVDEECVYEMQPVLIRKGEARAKELSGKDYHGKAVHGEPVWEGGLHDGWHPELGSLTPTGSRPGTGFSRPGTSYSRPGTSYMEVLDTGMPGSPTGMSPIREMTSRPGTTTRSTPNLRARA